MAIENKIEFGFENSDIDQIEAFVDDIIGDSLKEKNEIKFDVDIDKITDDDANSISQTLHNEIEKQNKILNPKAIKTIRVIKKCLQAIENETEIVIEGRIETTIGYNYVIKIYTEGICFGKDQFDTGKLFLLIFNIADCVEIYPIEPIHDEFENEVEIVLMVRNIYQLFA